MRLFNKRHVVRISNELRNELHECMLRKEEWNKNNSIRYSLDNNSRQIDDSDVRYSLPDDSDVRNKIDNVEDVKSVSVEKTIEEIVEEIKAVKKEPTFKDVLIGFIDERHLRDPQVYKKAHVDRRTFSKIINQTYGHTSKEIVIRLGLALELNLEDFEKLLKANNDSFSDISYGDIAIKYCIKHKIYDVDTVNDILYTLKLKLI